MSGSLVETALGRERALLIVAMAVLFLLAGLYTVFGVGMDMSAVDMTRMAGMRDMAGMREAGAWSSGYFVLVFLMWWVMMVAMMLPSVAPTVLLYAALLRRTTTAAPAPLTTALFLAGYLAAWAGFSLAAAVIQHELEAAGIVSATMMTLVDTVPGAIVLILAGVFQFTPWKDKCLAHCRSPAEFIVRRRHPGASGAFRMGLEHGVYCLGCCWVLMALLFVGGIMNLYWIVGLSAFVALEKLTPHGKLASRIAGAFLVAWGLWVILV
jgi:predicted metal-binding membrane protein